MVLVMVARGMLLSLPEETYHILIIEGLLFDNVFSPQSLELRQKIEYNPPTDKPNPAGAVGELGSAETEVNILMTRIGGEGGPGGQQLVTVRNHIDMAQDASGNSDTLKASQEINLADSELLKITQNLTADED